MVFKAIVANNYKLSGTSSDDYLTADGVNNTVSGGAGNDEIRLYNTSNGLSIGIGGTGNDTVISYYGGNNSLEGGSGDDLLISNNFYGNGTVDTLDGGDGNDTLLVYGYGSGKATLMNGGKGNDVIFGGEGNDTMNGGSGNDYFLTYQGDDSVDAGSGDDLIGSYYASYSGGNDTMKGGSGNDVFYYASDSGNNVITDFERGEDHVYISVAVSGVDTFGELTFVEQGSDVLMTFNGFAGHSILFKDADLEDIAQSDNFYIGTTV